MSQYGYNQTVFTQQAAGPTLTTAASASMLVAASPVAGQNRWTLPAGMLGVGTMLRFKAAGIISCAVTTPGTARFDLRIGGVVVVDSLAIPLNVVAQTNVPWWLEYMLCVRSIGATTAATVWGQGVWLSAASVNTAAPATGPGPGGYSCPQAPAISSGFDSTIAALFDAYFTQTVATGSLTCELAELTILN